MLTACCGASEFVRSSTDSCPPPECFVSAAGFIGAGPVGTLATAGYARVLVSEGLLSCNARAMQNVKQSADPADTLYLCDDLLGRGSPGRVHIHAPQQHTAQRLRSIRG